jgi:major membrane immunogen (membrane-anchored lipoprotein)
MKNIAIILILVAVTLFIGCSKASPSTHLTKAQVLTIAKPLLPLRAGESFHESFTNGTWTVWASDDGTIKGGWGGSTVLTIRDSDGKVLGETTNL